MGNCECSNEAKKQRSALEAQLLNFVPLKNRVKNIDKLFVKGSVLGTGVSCRVYKAIRKKDNVQVALKQMSRKNEFNIDLFRQEYMMLKKLSRLKFNHQQHLVQFEGVYIDSKNLYLCTKLCSGGQLLGVEYRRKHFSEKHVANIIRTVLRTISYCHNHNIVHRDLKPENILYDKIGDEDKIVIIDWAESMEIKRKNAIIDDLVGTPFYLSPESLRERKAWELKKTDMWCIGVITFLLLTGRVPFPGRNNQQIITKILNGTINWPKTQTGISKDAKKFILALLNRNTEKRLTASMALLHPWILHESQNDSHLGSQLLTNISTYHHAYKNIWNEDEYKKRSHESSCDQSIHERKMNSSLSRSFSTQSKKLLIETFVNLMSLKEQKIIMQAFNQIDMNQRGHINLKELESFLLKNHSSMDPEHIKNRAKELMQAIDDKQNGQISLSEFTRAHVYHRIAHNHPKHSFISKVKKYHKGLISENEVHDLIKTPFDEESATCNSHEDISRSREM